MSEPFDFESFINGTQLARGTVGFYKVDHRPEILRLTREHDALPVEGGDEREGSGPSKRGAVAAKIASLREEMEGSWVEFTIRTLTPDEFRRMSDDDNLDVYDQLEMQSIEPALSKDQWRRLADRIGTAQWSKIVSDANNLVLSKVAVPDFSRSVSETLSPTPSDVN